MIELMNYFMQNEKLIIVLLSRYYRIIIALLSYYYRNWVTFFANDATELFSFNGSHPMKHHQTDNKCNVLNKIILDNINKRAWNKKK